MLSLVLNFHSSGLINLNDDEVLLQMENFRRSKNKREKLV